MIKKDDSKVVFKRKIVLAQFVDQIVRIYDPMKGGPIAIRYFNILQPRRSVFSHRFLLVVTDLFILWFYYATMPSKRKTEVSDEDDEATYNEIIDHIVTRFRYGVCKLKEGKIDWNAIYDLCRKLEASNKIQLLLYKHSFYKRNILQWLMCVEGGPPIDLTLAILNISPDSASNKDIYGSNALEYGLRYKASTEVIAAILEKCPDAAKECSRKPSMSVIMREGVSVQLIKTVLTVWPDSAKKKDNEGMTILHHAMKNGASFELIQCIVKLCPDTIEAQDYRRMTAVKYGLSQKASTEVIKFLLNESNGESGNSLLLYAIKKGTSVEVLQTIEKKWPKSVEKIDANGMTTLHYAITHGATAEVLDWILKLFPKAVEMIDNKKRTPLHHALLNQTYMEDIQLILKQWPEAAKLKDENGMTPLFYGISKALSVDAIKKILSECPDSAKIKDNKGKSPLSYAIDHDSSNDVTEAILRAWPEAALGDKLTEAFVHSTIFTKSSSIDMVRDVFESCPELGRVINENGNTPLRCALENEVSSDKISIILNAWPDAAKVKDNKSRTPLLYAVANCLSIDVIASILAFCPETAAVQDIEGKIPLCHAIENDASVDILVLILNACPDAALIDKNAKLLLHYAIEKKLSIESVKEFLSVCPELARVMDSDGKTCLLRAIESEATPETVRVICHSWPDACDVKDANDITPIRYAMESNMSVELIDSLVSCCPESAKIKSTEGKNPLLYAIENKASIKILINILKAYPGAALENKKAQFLLHVAIDMKSSLEEVKEILITCPELVKVSQNEGITPLRYSIQQIASFDVIKLLFDAWTEAAIIKDDKGMTPLQYAMANNLSIDLIELFVVRCPRSAEIPDKQGRRPLCYAIENNVSIDSLINILQACPDVALKNDETKLLLHYAIKKEASINAIEDILSACPVLIEQTDAAGATPLHFAIRKGAPVEVVQLLLDEWPAGAKAKDKKGISLLQCGVENKVSTKAIKMILAHYPELAKEKNTSGLTLLSCAIKNNAPVDLLQAILKAYPYAALLDTPPENRPLLHHAIEEHLSSDAIKDMLLVCPKLIEVIDKDGSTTLLHAVKNAAPLETIKMILKPWPEAAMTKDNEGTTPLHYGIANKVPIDIIKVILTAYPESAKVKDADGFTLMRRAIENNVPADLLMAILKTCPEAAAEDIGNKSLLHCAIENVRLLGIVNDILAISPKIVKTTNIDGATPLHCAVANDVPTNIVRDILNAWPQAVSIKDKNGNTPLQCGIANKVSLSILKELLSSNPESVKGRNINDSSPLRCGMINNAPIEFLLMILKAYPETALEDVGVQSLLHYAIKKKCSVSVVKNILATNQKLIKMTDCDGVTPLLCSIKNESSVDIIRVLLNAWPEATNVKDKEGVTPLQYGIAHNCSMKVMEEIMASSSASMQEKDSSGRTPLRCAMENKVPFDDLKKILKACPEAALVDNKTKLLLHDAIERRLPTKAIKDIFETCPNLLKATDSDGINPLLCAIKNEAPLEVIQTILRAWPEAAGKKNEDGVTALQYGLFNKIPVSIILEILLLCPDSAREKDNHGKTPLCSAMENSAPMDILKALLKAHPDAAIENMKSNSLLHYAIAKGSWTGVIEEILTICPKLVEGTGRDGSTPLQYAIQTNAPIEIIQLILSAWPESALVMNEKNIIPLVHGILNNAPIDVVDTLIEGCPESVWFKDSNGKTPLNYALENKSSTSLLKSIIKVCPEAALADHYPQPVIHHALETGASIESLKDLVCYCPNLVKIADSNGATALQCAIKCEASNEIIDFVLDSWPEATEIRDKEGMTCLHYGILSKMSINMFEKILSLHLESTKEKDCFGNTPLYLGMKHEVSIGFIRSILKASPDVFLDDKNVQSVLSSKSDEKTNSEVEALFEKIMSVMFEKQAYGFRKARKSSKEIDWSVISHDFCNMKVKQMSSLAEFTETLYERNILGWMLNIRGGPPIELIEAIIYSNPSSASEVDIYGFNAFHHCVNNDVSLVVLEAILKQCPEAAKDYKDGSILSYVTSRGGSSDLIQRVLDTWPESVNSVDDNGSSILHHALKSGGSYELIKDIVKRCPNIIDIKNNESMTALDYGVLYKASVQIMKLLLNAANVDESLLFDAIGNGATVETLEAISDVCPKSLEVIDDNGMNVLHHATQHGASLDVIEWISNSYPKALQMTDKEKKTPLFYAIESRNSDACIHSILKKWPMAARMKDETGITALHLGLAKDPLPVESLKNIVAECPASAAVMDNEGNMPLRCAINKQAPDELIKIILEAFPNAALEDQKIPSVLNHVIENGSSFDLVETVLSNCPELSKRIDSEGNTPLRFAIEKEASIEVINIILNAWPEAAKRKDDEGMTLLHYVLSRNLAASIIEAILSACPESALEKDREGKTALLYCVEQRHKSCVTRNVFEYYKRAVDEEDDSGCSPIRLLVQTIIKISSPSDLACNEALRMLQLLLGGLRDGFPLQCLFQNNTSMRLQSILCAIGNYQWAADEALGGNFPVPTINLNRACIPGQTLLELLVEYDSNEATEIFFQIKNKVEASGEQKLIEIQDAKNPAIIVASFVSFQSITQSTWLNVANRAVQSNTKKLRDWGENYGRLFGRFRIANSRQVKHQSNTSVVVIGTELVKNGGVKSERKVVMKFVADDAIFKRELEQRQNIIQASINAGLDAEKHIVLIEEAFTNNKKLATLKTSHGRVQFVEDLSDIISEFKNVPISLVDTHTKTTPICHVVIMKYVTANDLNDVISHHNIAGKKVDVVRNLAISIAKNLRFLNETCQVMHGDVEARNFIPSGTRGDYVTIDLDSSSNIAGMEAVDQKEIGSGCLPPEQAEVLYAESEKANKNQLPQAANKQEYLSKNATRIGCLQNVIFQGVKPVKASSQYDMWCFGVMVYEFCTGKHLFQMDNREEFKQNDLLKIKNWTVHDIAMKLELINADVEWRALKATLERVLHPNPIHRPTSWNEVIGILESQHNAESETQVEEEVQVTTQVENKDGIMFVPDNAAALTNNIQITDSFLQKKQLIQAAEVKNETEGEPLHMFEENQQIKFRQVSVLEENEQAAGTINIRRTKEHSQPFYERCKTEQDVEHEHKDMNALIEALEIAQRAQEDKEFEVTCLQKEVSIAKKQFLQAESSRAEMQKILDETNQRLAEEGSNRRNLLTVHEKTAKENYERNATERSKAEKSLNVIQKRLDETCEKLIEEESRRYKLLESSKELALKYEELKNRERRKFQEMRVQMQQQLDKISRRLAEEEGNRRNLMLQNSQLVEEMTRKLKEKEAEKKRLLAEAREAAQKDTKAHILKIKKNELLLNTDVLENLTQQLEEKEAEKKRLQVEAVEKANEALAREAKLKEEMNRILENKESENDRLLADAHAICQAMKREIHASSQIIYEMRKKMKATETENSRLLQEKASLQVEACEAAEAVPILKDKLKYEMTRKLEEKEEEIERLQAHVQEIQKIYEAKKKALDTSSEVVAELKRKLKETEAEKERLLVEARKTAENTEQERLKEMSQLQQELRVAKEASYKAEASRLEVQMLFEEARLKLEYEKSEKKSVDTSSEGIAELKRKLEETEAERERLLVEARKAAENTEQERLEEVSQLQQELLVAKEASLKAEASRLEVQALFEETCLKLEEEKSERQKVFERSKHLAQEYEEMKIAEKSLLAVMEKVVEDNKRGKRNDEKRKIRNLSEQNHDVESNAAGTEHDHTTTTAPESTYDKYSRQEVNKVKNNARVSGEIFESSKDAALLQMEPGEVIEALYCEEELERSLQSQEPEIEDLCQVPTIISIEKDKPDDVGSLSSDVIREKFAEMSNSITNFLHPARDELNQLLGGHCRTDK